MDENENEEVMVSDPVPLMLTEAEIAAAIVGENVVLTEDDIDGVPAAFEVGDAHADGPDA